MTAPYHSLSAYRTAVEVALEAGDFEKVLLDLALKAEAVKNDPLAIARVFGSPTLDGLCDQLGHRVAAAFGLDLVPAAAHGIPQAIYICSETAGMGGHTRVMADLIRADPRRLHHVVFTNLFNRSDSDLYTAEFERLGARITILAKGPALDRLRQLLALLAGAPPSRVFLFNHHQDAIAVAGVAGVDRHERIFVHHCDHNFCLGVFLPQVVHVDLHTMGFHRCRHSLGLTENIYWPLTCADSPDRRQGSFLGSGGLVTCCCGTGNKFVGHYPINYFDTVAERLHRIGGKHVHIGPIDPPHRQHLAAQLQARGVALDRFVYLQSVPDLRQALREQRVDLYLVSFPLGGGRALIEAMAAGVPVVGHANHRDKLLGGADLLPQEAPVWTEVSELIGILGSLTPERLESLSRVSRARYEAHHHPQLLAACVAEGRQLEPPPERITEVEPLQAFWFERAFTDVQAAPRPPAGTTPGRLRFA